MDTRELIVEERTDKALNIATFLLVAVIALALIISIVCTVAWMITGDDMFRLVPAVTKKLVLLLV